MIQLVISPRNGWIDIARANRNSKELLSTGLYPLIGLASLSSFIGLFFHAELTMVEALQKAIVTFICYFATYFFANLMFSTFLSRVATVTDVDDSGDKVGSSMSYNPDERIYNTFIIYNLGLLALITLIENVTVIEVSILQFLPFGVALIMWKGVDFMRIPEKRVGQFMFLAVFSILMPVYIGQYLFQSIMN